MIHSMTHYNIFIYNEKLFTTHNRLIRLLYLFYLIDKIYTSYILRLIIRQFEKIDNYGKHCVENISIIIDLSIFKDGT